MYSYIWNQSYYYDMATHFLLGAQEESVPFPSPPVPVSKQRKPWIVRANPMIPTSEKPSRLPKNTNKKRSSCQNPAKQQKQYQQWPEQDRPQCHLPPQMLVINATNNNVSINNDKVLTTTSVEPVQQQQHHHHQAQSYEPPQQLSPRMLITDVLASMPPLPQEKEVTPGIRPVFLPPVKNQAANVNRFSDTMMMPPPAWTPVRKPAFRESLSQEAAAMPRNTAATI